MNGRVYDYNLGRFMSVDPFIQAPLSSQSLNPYSYIMNNPMAGVDPTGYVAQGTNASSWRTSGCDLDPGGCTSTPAERAISTYVGSGQGNMHQSFSDNIDKFNDRMQQQLEDNWTNYAYAGITSVTITDLPNGTSENQHVPLTSDERQFAKDGMLKEYWNSRHDRGDPWAAAGLALWDPEHEAVTDAHKDMAKVLQGRLIYEGVDSGNLTSNASLGEMKAFMRDVGVAVMRGHAVAVQRDFSGKLGDRYGVLDKYQAAVFHHKVFSSKGLRPSVYGGTPMGFGNYVPLINTQAKVSNWVAGLNPSNKAYCVYMCFGQGYISNEDTHHDPAGK